MRAGAVPLAGNLDPANMSSLPKIDLSVQAIRYTVSERWTDTCFDQERNVSC